MSLIYGRVCVCLCARVCVHCFFGDVWEAVGKSNTRATGRVSSGHSRLNCEPLVFLGGRGEGLSR